MKPLRARLTACKLASLLLRASLSVDQPRTGPQWFPTERASFVRVALGNYCAAGAAPRNLPNFAVARNCGIGSSSLNAEVNAFDRLHIVRGWNSSCCGLK